MLLNSLSANSTLAGMLCIIILLWSLDAASSDLSGSVMGAFAPAVDWVARWLPLFYVPALIQIPIHLSAFSSEVHLLLAAALNVSRSRTGRANKVQSVEAAEAFCSVRA